MKSLLYLITLLFFGAIIIPLSCKKEYSCEGCNSNKQTPIARAGNDSIIILPSDSAILDGTASIDPDGTISNYKWLKISGPVNYSIVNSIDVKSIVKNLNAGIYKFELKVTDNDGLSAKDTVQIMVTDPDINQPPVADAGADTIIFIPSHTAILNGTGSFDPENDIVDYAWSKILGPPLFNIININTIQTQVNNLVQGIYQFELKVTDAGGLFSKDTIMVTVSASSSNNIPPDANAGLSLSVNYDLQKCSTNPENITLNGSASHDTDGTIVTYLWAGPGLISSPNTATTNVSNLSIGSHQFVLMVTDNYGATDSDTVIITVSSMMNRPIVQAQLILIGTLSQPISTIAAAGNKILIVGSTGNGPGSKRVDIYNIITGEWAISELSEARSGMGVAILGDKIFFGGGAIQEQNFAGGWHYDALSSSVVDIYNTSNNTWATAQLSKPRSPVGVTAGNTIVFAGGDDKNPSPVIDIYNSENNMWSATMLSEGKHILQAASNSSKIFLAGGSGSLLGVGGNFISKELDIYDVTSNSWSKEYLSMERGEMGVINLNNKIFMGGGAIRSNDPSVDFDATNSVEIRDLINKTTSFKCLSEPKRGIFAYKKDNKIIFLGGWNNKFDIYDLTTDLWSIGLLPINLVNPSVSVYNNTIYLAGGEINGVASNKLWKLEF